MARSGPITKDTSTVALGLAQIRVGASASNIATVSPVLSSGNSIGALANTKFTSKIDLWRLESGFPLLEDAVIPIKETASMECAFKEITPMNLAFARGLDASTGYTATHSGEIRLGTMAAPAYVRMEAVYTYPNGSNYMTIIFPRAQVDPNIEADFKDNDAAASPLVFNAKNADSSVTGGNANWDIKPLGVILFT
jgi:hypothetical protein